jgi:hypothetical protein
MCPKNQITHIIRKDNIKDNSFVTYHLNIHHKYSLIHHISESNSIHLAKPPTLQERQLMNTT